MAETLITQGFLWWAHKGSNLGPLPCEGNALPLSYAPGIVVHRRRRMDQPRNLNTPSVRGRDLRSAGYRCQAFRGEYRKTRRSGALLAGAGGVRLQRPDAL